MNVKKICDGQTDPYLDGLDEMNCDKYICPEQFGKSDEFSTICRPLEDICILRTSHHPSRSNSGKK